MVSIVHFDREKNLWSVTTGRKTELKNNVSLQNVTFFVNEKARDFIRNHNGQPKPQFSYAFMMGEEKDWDGDDESVPFIFDPKQNHPFVLETNGCPLYDAQAVVLNGRKKLVLL